MFSVSRLNRCVFREDLNEEIGMDYLTVWGRWFQISEAWNRKYLFSVCFEWRNSKQSSIWSRTKLSRRGADGQQFRQVFWACAINDRETQGGKLIIDSLGDGKPVQWAKKKGNVAMLRRFEDNTCSVILTFLFWVCLTDTLGFQLEESCSNRFWKGQMNYI